MGRALDRYPLEILEVLDVTVPAEIRRLMSAALKGRFSRFPASLSDAQKVAKIDSTMATEIRSSRLDKAAVAFRSLLVAADNIHAWFHACLKHLIQKSMELRPYTVITRGAGLTFLEEFETAESGNDHLLTYTGPPSWVEKQRMIKKLWRLQFFPELQGAGNKSRLSAHWPRQEVDVFSKSSLDDFYDVFDFERQLALTAYDFSAQSPLGPLLRWKLFTKTPMVCQQYVELKA
jgi:hypothetical protein